MTHSSLSARHGNRADAAVSLAEAQLKRDVIRVRIAALLLAVSIGLAIAWLLPWIPVGMRESDYNTSTVVGVVVLTCVAIASVAFAVRWTPMLQQEPLSELMKVLMGQSILVRGKARFLRRLETQCDRARDERGAGFSLLILQLPQVDRQRPEDEERFSGWLGAVRNAVRAQDVVGDSGAGEIWLLLQGAGPEGCAGVADRIREGVPLPPAANSPGPEFLIGYAAFGIDGIDAETLFRIARLAAQRTQDQSQAA